MPDAPFAQGDPDNPIDLHESVVRHDLPAGYWRFEVAAPLEDSSENANTLSAVGSPTDAAGLITVGRGRDFSGTAQAYTAADHSTLDVGDTFTVEAWINADSVSGHRTILSKGANGIQFKILDGELRLDKQGVGGIIVSSISLSAGQTYHVVATKTGSSEAKLYVNGVDRSGSYSNQTIADTSTDLNIGRHSGASEYFDGRIDEVAIYPYALTADMVATHYESGEGSFGVQAVGWLPGVKVEVAFESSAHAQYPLWFDVTEALRDGGGIRIEGSGRPNEITESQPGGGALVFDNREGDFTPAGITGLYAGNVRPMRQVRIRCAWDNGLYWLFRGWIPSWRPRYADFGMDATVEVEFVDGFFVLEQAQLPVGQEFSEQAAGARIEAVLALANVPTSLWNVDDGFVTLPAIAEGDVTGSCLDHVRDVMDSDGGFFYIGPDGRFVYEDRTYRAFSQQTALATFGDGGGAELPYRDIEPSNDTDFLFNDARFTAGDGTGTASASDSASRTEYGRHTYPAKTLLTGFNQAEAAAEWIVGRYKDPSDRFTAVEFKGANAPDDLWPWLLAAWNSNRFEFVNRPLGGDTVTLDEFLERASHAISMADWTTVWAVSPHGDEDPWLLGDASYVLGDNTIPTW